MRFFVDRCISISVARGLAEFVSRDGHEVKHLDDRFEANTKDADWILELGAEGDWIIVSGDPRISSSKAERAAWMESRLTAFFFQDLARRSFWVQVQEVVRWWPMIVERSRTLRSPHGFLLRFKAREPEQIYP